MPQNASERFEQIIKTHNVSEANLSFEDSIARIDFPEVDISILFESVQDDPEATWKGGTLLLSASRISVIERDDEFEVPIDGVVTIELAGVPRPSEWE